MPIRIVLVAPCVPTYIDRMEFWTIDGDSVRWLGVVLFGAGGALRLWPVFVLGDRFSGLVAIQPGYALVIPGVYSSVKHPSYLGLLIKSLGWSVAFRSGAGVLLTLLLLPPLIAGFAPKRRCCFRSWRRVRGISSPHVATHSGDLLAQARSRFSQLAGVRPAHNSRMSAASSKTSE